MRLRIVLRKIKKLPLFVVVLAGCMEPPPPTKTVSVDVSIGTDGCPTVSSIMVVNRNDKVSWQLDPESVGYPSVEAFGVTFTDNNPSYCVSDVWVPKAETITCTIKADALQEFACYEIATRANGGVEQCKSSSGIRVEPGQDGTCQ